MNNLDTIPETVGKAFGITSSDETICIGHGMVNATHIATKANGKKIVLQKLHSIFDERLVDDFVTITRFLSQKNWEVPVIVKTVTGTNFIKDDEANIWRAMSFIDSKVSTGSVSKNGAEQLSIMLAKLHLSLSESKLKPTFVIKHFHETNYYAKRLSRLYKVLPNNASKQFAKKVLDAYKKIPSITPEPTQLLHGDPRASNALYRHKKPFTWIDFDTIMTGPVWLDIGDFLRSMMEEKYAGKQTMHSSDFQKIVDAYFKELSHGFTRVSFTVNAALATKIVALELTMRFLIDVVEDNYFGWDKTTYSSRKDSNMSKAELQFAIYEQVLEFYK